MGDFGEDSDESDGEGGLGNVNRAIMRPPGHSGKAKRGHLCFDASFETGNLGRVDLVNEYEYDLFIRPDTCSPRLRFWFNFTVDNVRQDQRVIFNIVNISKSRNVFNEGMTPIVKSSTRPKWQRIPKRNVFYYKSALHQGNYILSFAFGFDREDEVFQFALTLPYSYSKLQVVLTALESKASHLKGQFKRETLANSVQNRRLDLITLGATERPIHPEKRRVVAVMARVHPGEAPSSFVCQGLLELLISSHAVANVLRQHVLFKIIPMLNPDGVFLGNYRATSMGFDLNRSWHLATPWGHPTLKAALDLLVAMDKSKEFQLDFIVDIHANTTLKGCFIYGNTYEDVYRYERHIVFPKLLGTLADDYSGENAMFNADASKIGTSRRHLCATLSNHVNCYSFEVSIFGYQLKGSNVTVPYTEESYMRCGRNLLRAFLEYYHLTGAIPIEPTAEISQKKRAKTHRSRSRSTTRSAYKKQPNTGRTCALMHFMDLTINYDSETSFEDMSSFRNPSCRFSARDAGLVKEKRKKKFTGEENYSKYSRIWSPPPATITVMPKPSLSIINFNQITRIDGGEGTKAKKK